MDSQNGAVVGQKIVEALGQSNGYVTVPYLAEKIGSPLPFVREYLREHPEKVRKSSIQTDSGETLYMLNTPLSGIADAWHAFRFANAKKF